MKTAESRQGCRHENGWDNQKGESSDGVTQHSWSGRGHQLDAARHDGRQVGVEATRTSGTEAVAENCHRIKVETRNTGEPVDIKGKFALIFEQFLMQFFYPEIITSLF